MKGCKVWSCEWKDRDGGGPGTLFQPGQVSSGQLYWSASRLEAGWEWCPRVRQSDGGGRKWSSWTPSSCKTCPGGRGWAVSLLMPSLSLLITEGCSPGSRDPSRSVSQSAGAAFSHCICCSRGFVSGEMSSRRRRTWQRHLLGQRIWEGRFEGLQGRPAGIVFPCTCKPDLLTYGHFLHVRGGA